MSGFEILGWVAAAFGAGFSLVQLWRTLHTESTAGITTSSWMALSLVAGVWVAYGFHNGVPQQYLPNIPLVLTASAMGWFHHNRFRSLVPVALLIAATASGYVDSAIPGLIGVPLGMSMALPQLIAVRRATDLTGVSLPAWVSQLVAIILWLVFGIGEGKAAIVISASTQTVICGVLVATLALRRRATPPKHQQRGVISH